MDVGLLPDTLSVGLIRVGMNAHPNVMDSTLLLTASLCQACQIGLASKDKRGSHCEC